MIRDVISEAESRMKKAHLFLSNEFGTVRTGRASPSLLENVMLDYYGSKTPISHLATISVPEPQLLVIQPWDKATIEMIEKAIQTSNLGLNPMNDGNLIRLPFPPLTEERRKELVKTIHKMAENEKVTIRNIRRDANEMLEELEKTHEISEDEYHRALEEVQKLTDKHIDEIGRMLEIKEKEIMTV